MITHLELRNRSIEGTTTGKEMGLSANSSAIVFQMFINNNYSNPIGSICREIASNCFDSHIEAKVNLPVLIKKTFDAETNQHFISFVDFGVGLSPERMDSIYGVLFESTKNDSNEQIGGFGIGSKSPMAYKRKTGIGSKEYDNSFYVTTVFEGTKYYYLVYEGDRCPIINPIFNEPCSDGNGTEVSIRVLPNDISKFENELFRQLYYFENIVFEGFEEYGKPTNKYQIVKAKNFIFRGTDYSSQIHVCLGKVAYPIDYTVVDVENSDYNYPIALKFEIGELNVTRSREQLDYSEETINAIKAKIVEAKAEMREILEKQLGDVRTLEDYIQEVKKPLVLKLNSTHSFALNKNIFKVVYPNFRYNHLNLPTDESLFDYFCTFSTLGKQYTQKERRYSASSSIKRKYEELIEKNNYYWSETELQKNVLLTKYLKEKHERYYVIHLQDKPLCNLEVMQTGFKDCVLTEDDAQELLEDYNEILKSKLRCYDEIEIPERFIEAKKAKERARCEKGSIIMNIICKGNKNRVRAKLSDLYKFNGTIYYGTKEEEYQLNRASVIFPKLFSIFTTGGYFENGSKSKFLIDDSEYRIGKKAKANIMFVFVANSHIKQFKFCKKALPISEFTNTMLSRKFDVIQKEWIMRKLYNRKQELNRLFLKPEFALLNSNLESSINFINSFKIELNSTINNDEYSIRSFYNVEPILSFQHKKFMLACDKIIKCGESYDPYLEFINVPSFYQDENVEYFWKLIDNIGKSL